MDLRLPDRLRLARLPTPLEKLTRIGAEAGIDLWVKRDDLTGLALSGNKVRKLEFLAAAALGQGADTLITCGAVTSNHARATAVAAARLGLSSHLLLRGGEPALPEGNLLLDRLVGAATTFIEPRLWPERDARMQTLASLLGRQGRRAYVIPEGGSNEVGSLGYVLAARELLDQAQAAGIEVQAIVHAAGSGGTTAGLALGLAALGRSDIDLLGVAVCEDGPWFHGAIHRILDDAVRSGYVSTALRDRARWRIVEGFQGEGYARTTADEMALYAHVARSEGLFLDPVYSGKAFRALLAGYAAPAPGATVFWHTGGLFGLFSFAAAIHSLDGPGPASAPPAS